jgi:hypothetical protein
MATASLEERVAAIEAELAQLKQRLTVAQPPGGMPWWKQIIGVFEHDVEFDEAMRLGREYRQSLRPHDEHATEATA